MKIHRKLGALAVLSATAGVSMLAGSVLLGTASADEPPSTTNTNVASATQAFSIAYRADASGDGDALVPSCTIVYRAWTDEDGEMPTFEPMLGAAPTFAVRAIAAGDIEGAIASGEIKLLEPREAGDFTVTGGKGEGVAGRRIVVKPGEEPQVFEWSGEAGELPEGFEPGKPFEWKAGELPEGFEPIDPEHCTVINALDENGEITLPDGTKVKPAASITLP